MNVNLSIEGETHIDIDCELIAPLWFVKKTCMRKKIMSMFPAGKESVHVYQQIIIKKKASQFVARFHTGIDCRLNIEAN